MILVAESGSTKTDWRFCGSNDEAFGWKTVGINPFYQSKESIEEIIHQDVFSRLNQAPKAVYYYGTGITGDQERQVLGGIFRAQWPKITDIQIESDIIAAARALFGDKAGLAAILGTGSNSVWYADGKIAHQIPPLGFWLGDEGSGGHLGKQLVLAYLHGEMPTSTRAVFEDQFGTFDRSPIMEAAYQKPYPNRYFAQYTPFIQAHITDPYLENMVIQSFTLFFEKYLHKYPQKNPVGFVGSVAHYFREQLLQVAKQQGFAIQEILAAPIESLVQYHVKTPLN